MRVGLLPQAEEVGSSIRWYWRDVVAWIKARNGKSDEYAVNVTGDVHRIGDEDPFSLGVKRVTTTNA